MQVSASPRLRDIRCRGLTALVDKSERVLEVWTAAKLFGSQALITAALGHRPYQYFGPPVLLKQICLFPLATP